MTPNAWWPRAGTPSPCAPAYITRDTPYQKPHADWHHNDKSCRRRLAAPRRASSTPAPASAAAKSAARSSASGGPRRGGGGAAPSSHSATARARSRRFGLLSVLAQARHSHAICSGEREGRGPDRRRRRAAWPRGRQGHRGAPAGLDSRGRWSHTEYTPRRPDGSPARGQAWMRVAPPFSLAPISLIRSIPFNVMDRDTKWQCRIPNRSMCRGQQKAV